MAKRITFTRDFDYEWPSRCVSAGKAGVTDLVKDELADAAIAAGAATLEVDQSQPEAPGEPVAEPVAAIEPPTDG